MTNRFVVTPQTRWAALLSNNFGNENVRKIELNFIVNFDKLYVTTCRCPKIPSVFIADLNCCCEWIYFVVKTRPWNRKKNVNDYVVIKRKYIKITPQVLKYDEINFLLLKTWQSFSDFPWNNLLACFWSDSFFLISFLPTFPYF